MSLRPPVTLFESIRDLSQWCQNQVTAYQEVFYTSEITPAQITSNQDDFTPTGLPTVAVMRLSSDTTRSITGLSGGKQGRFITLYNVGGSTITLTDEDSNSVAANRFTCPSSSNFSLVEAGKADLWYDDTTSRWRVS